MQEQFNKEGKRYISVTDEEIKLLPPATRIYHIAENIKGIVPEDCKHDFIITGGTPKNIKGCKHCIYWEFTREQPTE